MKLTQKIVFVAIAAAACTSAFAQKKDAGTVYAELGYTNLKATVNGIPDVKPAAARLILGAEINPNLAIEGMIAVSAKSDTVTVTGQSVDVKLKDAYGIFLKPQVNATDSLSVFARIGYVHSRINASSNTGSASDSSSDLAYGAGMSYKLTPSTSVNLDYVNYYSKDGTTVKGYTVGLGYKF